MVKILHCGDIHLDSPFKSSNAGKSETCRKELRNIFSSLILYIIANKIDIALIAGDLFDGSFATGETAKFVARELENASSCRFVISPGNHDPYTPDGVYSKTDFPSNVFIFSSEEPSKFSFPELNTDVYGYAFTKSTLEHYPFAGKKPDDASKINILCAHADIGNPLSPYCPVSESDIKTSEFDYCAFGHIHNTDGVKKEGNVTYAYSGCLEGRDFGETGHKGAIIAEINKSEQSSSVKTNQIIFSKHRYEIFHADISFCTTFSDILTKIKNAILESYGKDTLLRVILSGIVSPSLKINISELENALLNELFYLEIKDNTLPLYATDILENDPTVKGAFFKEIRPLLEQGTASERAVAAAALRYGLSALSGEDI